MISRHYARRRLPLMFPRTASAAFKDASYASAIERPAPSLWRRLLAFITRSL